MHGVHRCLAIVAALCGGLVCGCALFDSGRDIFSFWPAVGETTGHNPLPPIRPARDALQIDIVFAERPLDDPILGKSLWSDIDQVGPIPKEERAALGRLGLRVGNAGTTPGPALEKLLQLTSDPVGDRAAKNRMTVQKRTFCLGPSEEAPIETNTVGHCAVEVPTLSGKKEKTYDNFKSILRMTVHRLQDGWARVDFVPEMHHGKEQFRAVALAGGLQQRQTQEIDALPSSRFSIKLQVGEMAVVTAEPDSPRSFGHYGFISEDPTKGTLQRVLIVRLANMSRVDPLYSPSASSSSSSSRASEDRLPGAK